MRHILVDTARARHRVKRGGGPQRVAFDQIPDLWSGRDRKRIAIEDALQAPAKIDPRKAHVIELRFFGGLSVEETAEVLKIYVPPVLRDWRLARAWLLREMAGA